MLKRCRVQMYDSNVKSPPYTFIALNEFVCERPIDDYLGEKFWIVLDRKCSELGYVFKFYSMGSDGYDYDVVVYEDVNYWNKLSDLAESELLTKGE